MNKNSIIKQNCYLSFFNMIKLMLLLHLFGRSYQIKTVTKVYKINLTIGLDFVNLFDLRTDFSSSSCLRSFCDLVLELLLASSCSEICMLFLSSMLGYEIRFLNSLPFVSLIKSSLSARLSRLKHCKR